MSLKFLSYNSATEGTRVGLVSGNETSVVPINYPNGEPVRNMHSLVEAWELVCDNLEPGIPEEDLSNVEILAPFRGRDVIAVGKNYKAHAKEFQNSGFDASSNTEQPDFPVIFTKRASSIVPMGHIIYPHPEVTKTLDYEGELGVVIGKGGIGIKKEDAWKHIWGAVIINDITARERQRDHKQFYIGKSLDTFCPMGPYAVPGDNLDWDKLILETRVNGETRQKQSTSDLIFDIPTLIETCSVGITLMPGDIIATGTPAGVGIGKNPPMYLQPGDAIDVEITGLGKLSNGVAQLSSVPPKCRPVLESTDRAKSSPDSLRRTCRNGAKLHVNASNDASGNPAIIFVHGLGGSSSNWDAVIESSQIKSQRQIITFDFEGHGLSPLSSSLSSPLSVESISESIGDVLDVVGVKKASIVAHSLGGLAATTFASKHPERVEKLLLLGPVKQLGPPGVKAMNERAAMVKQNGMSGVAETISNVGISEKSKTSKPLVKAAVHASCLAILPEGYSRACIALANSKDPDYSSIKAPTLILSGTEDKTSPAATTEFLQNAITGSQVAMLPDVGHWHLFEQYESVARALDNFL